MDERSGNGTKNSELTSLRMIRVLLHKLLNFNVEDKSTMKTALNDLNYYLLKYPKYKKLNTILAGGWNYKRMSPNEAVAQITRLQKFVKDQGGNGSSIEGSVLNIILKKILSIYLKEVGQENNSSKEYGSENSNHITSGAFAITELEGHSREKIEHETESGSDAEFDPNALGEYTTSEQEVDYESEYSSEVNFDQTTIRDYTTTEPEGHASEETEYETESGSGAEINPNDLGEYTTSEPDSYLSEEIDYESEYSSEVDVHTTTFGNYSAAEPEGHSLEETEYETISGSGEEIDPNELGEYTTSEPDSYSSEEIEYESEYKSEYSYEVNFDTTTFADNSKSEPKGHSSKETDYELDVHIVGGSTPEVSSEHSTDQNEATTKLPLDPKSTELFFEGVTMNSGATRSDFVTEQLVLEETVTELYFEQINFEDYYNELNRPLKEFTTPKELIVSEGERLEEMKKMYEVLKDMMDCSEERNCEKCNLCVKKEPTDCKIVKKECEPGSKRLPYLALDWTRYEQKTKDGSWEMKFCPPNAIFWTV